MVSRKEMVQILQAYKKSFNYKNQLKLRDSYRIFLMVVLVKAPYTCCIRSNSKFKLDITNFTYVKFYCQILVLN